ncbi:MAG: hypothetical protein R2909_19625 [Gemmatimonadales bacterium]
MQWVATALTLDHPLLYAESAAMKLTVVTVDKERKSDVVGSSSGPGSPRAR